MESKYFAFCRACDWVEGPWARDLIGVRVELHQKGNPDHDCQIYRAQWSRMVDSITTQQRRQAVKDTVPHE